MAASLTFFFKSKPELNVFLTTLRLLTNNLEEMNKKRIDRLQDTCRAK
jgi:hypothetical protein